MTVSQLQQILLYICVDINTFLFLLKLAKWILKQLVIYFQFPWTRGQRKKRTHPWWQQFAFPKFKYICFNFKFQMSVSNHVKLERELKEEGNLFVATGMVELWSLNRNLTRPWKLQPLGGVLEGREYSKAKRVQQLNSKFLF